MASPVSIDDRRNLEKIAGNIAARYGKFLLHNAKSVKKIETVLTKLYAGAKRRHASEETISNLALVFGAYIVAIIEHKHGKGSWERDDPDFGKGSYPFYWRGQTLFPVAWCYKRLTEGEGDNVWYKYYISVLYEENDEATT